MVQIGNKSTFTYKGIFSAQKKISIGIWLIIMSPMLGAVLSALYGRFLETMITTDLGIKTLWLGCIVALAIWGLSLVVIGCSEKVNRNENNSL